MKNILFFIFCMTSYMTVMAQETIPLYQDGIPNSKPAPDEEFTDTAQEGFIIIHKISRPTIGIYLPAKEKATGAAVIIYPGGGYAIVAGGHEGYDVARRFNEMGVAAFVVKYRIPDSATMIHKEIGPLQDAQKAIQYVRENAAQWGVDPHRIGIAGFSAGGHLAATAGTHFKKAYISNPRNTSLRPDFMILGYPVISFTDSIGHIGSRDNLIGKHPSAAMIREYSNELQVTPETPPTFLVHAKDDDGVSVKNSLAFAKALSTNGVAHEVYLYEKGGHGFGLNNATSTIKWMDRVESWMKTKGWLQK